MLIFSVYLILHTNQEVLMIMIVLFQLRYQTPKLIQFCTCIVTKFMMHGPCGVANPKSPCMVNGSCSKNFPKDYVEETYAGPDGYPHYRRRNTRRCINKSGVLLDNKYVVPYNPYLLIQYNAHIIVEICSSVQSCKYLYKYVYKGPDMASIAVEKDQKNDEIKKFVNSWFITASECMWRFFGFDIHGQSPSVQCLAVHEEDKHTVVFNEQKPQQALEKEKKTTLLAWFELNWEDERAHVLKYHEIPQKYVWDEKKRKWKEQKRGKMIGHVYTTNLKQSAMRI